MNETRLKADTQVPSLPGRRAFIGKAVAGVAGIAGLSYLATESARADIFNAQSEDGPSGRKRRKQAYQKRLEAARRERDRPVPEHPNNGDEELYPNRIASYSKGLPHNSLGEVDLPAYDSLIRALNSGILDDFEKITLGLGRKLTNPQAGLAFVMQGPDSHALIQKPAPAFSSPEEASEIAENYWMALARDVPFSQYDSNPLTNAAAVDLSGMSDFRGPKIEGRITTDTLFRGATAGDLTGPYISQFMWMDTPFGAETISRRMRTIVSGDNYMTDYDEWLAVQNGATPGPNLFDTVPRYTGIPGEKSC